MSGSRSLCPEGLPCASLMFSGGYNPTSENSEAQCGVGCV